MTRLNRGVLIPTDDDQLAEYPTILGSGLDALAGGVSTALAFRAGYQSYSALFPCTVLKLGRLVVLQGLVGPVGGANLAAGSNVAIADVPVDCRPSQDLYRPAATASATGEARVIINADGSVRINNELATPYVSVGVVYATA